MAAGAATTSGALHTLLQALIAAGANGREAYAWVADHAASSEVRRLAQRHELRWAANALRLRHICASMPGCDRAGQFTGFHIELAPLHRTWLNLRAMLGRDGDHGLMRMCLRGERANLQRFEQTLACELPNELRFVLDDQRDDIERACVDLEMLIAKLDGGG